MVVVIVAMLLARTAPVGDAAMLTGDSAGASATDVGPPPGPTWLTRSKLVPSYCRGMSLPNLPSEMAMYSRPKSVADFACALEAMPDAICVNDPGVNSPHN